MPSEAPFHIVESRNSTGFTGMIENSNSIEKNSKRNSNNRTEKEKEKEREMQTWSEIEKVGLPEL